MKSGNSGANARIPAEQSVEIFLKITLRAKGVAGVPFACQQK